MTTTLPPLTETGSELLLEARDIEVVHKREGQMVRAVAGASIDVRAGEIVGLVGESGCGKSSLARAIVGINQISAGEVRFQGNLVAQLGRGSRPQRFRGLQMVFQSPYASLNPRRTVGAQIADAVLAHRGGRRRATGQRVAELLDRVGLSPASASKYPNEFSGGQRQRIAIARVLAAEPNVIVLDEPLSSLDASAQAQVANLLQELARELSLGLLLISHDLAIVRHITARLSVMYLGTIVESGLTADIWTAPSHPYSQALIESVPLADGSGTKPRTLAGEVPDPADPPTGCRFHPRCPLVHERCASEVPLLTTVDGRAVACWARLPHDPTPSDNVADPRRE